MPARLSRTSRSSGAPRRRTALTLGAATLVGTVVGGPLLTGTAQAASAADWQKLAMCESGGNWAINTGNGFYGGLQFTSSTWLGFGGGAYASRADFASASQQMAIADKVLAVQGWNAWPSCSRSAGLYGTSTSPAPAPAPAPPPPPPLVVQGAIYQHWIALGGTNGVLGSALSSEAGSVGGGRYNVFSGGTVYWTPAQGAWAVTGGIRQHWQALGSEYSPLGYPVSDEQDTAGRAGRVSVFQGGAVYWTAATGAREVRGGIHQTWVALGAQNSALGFPTSDEQDVPGREAAVEQFEQGSIGWTPQTGTKTVMGAINATWTSMGGATSSLGMPVSGEYAVPGGRRSTFEHGSLTWTPSGGVSVAAR